MASRSRGLMRMLREIFISSSTCSLVLDISLRASRAGACCFLPPFSFWAAIISWRFLSASSSLFFFSSASRAFFSASSLRTRSSSSRFWAASFFSCSARISFLLACFLAHALLLLALLGGQLLLLLGADLLPLGLLLLHALELFLLLLALVPPLV